MGREERTQGRGEGLQGAAKGFEDAPVGLLVGNDGLALLVGRAGVEGFLFALLSASAGAGAAFGCYLCGHCGCECSGDVFDVLGLAGLCAALDRSCVLVRLLLKRCSGDMGRSYL